MLRQADEDYFRRAEWRGNLRKMRQVYVKGKLVGRCRRRRTTWRRR